MLKDSYSCSKMSPISETLTLSIGSPTGTAFIFPSTEIFGEVAANMKSNLSGNNYGALPKMQASLCPADSSVIPACLFTETRIEHTRKERLYIMQSLATDCLRIILAIRICHCDTAHHSS